MTPQHEPHEKQCFQAPKAVFAHGENAKRQWNASTGWRDSTKEIMKRCHSVSDMPAMPFGVVMALGAKPPLSIFGIKTAPRQLLPFVETQGVAILLGGCFEGYTSRRDELKGADSGFFVQSWYRQWKALFDRPFPS